MIYDSLKTVASACFELDLMKCVHYQNQNS